MPYKSPPYIKFTHRTIDDIGLSLYLSPHLEFAFKDDPNSVISYEFPTNEKVRTLLRLEDLFARTRHFSESAHSNDHHAAITTLFEILEVISRADLKSELLQELERQRRALALLHQNPHISEHALNFILEEIDAATQKLQNMFGKTGQHLRENEWLMGIKQRAAVPGGTCEFDLPSYHYWQQQPEQTRRDFLTQWLAPLLPIRTALKILLKLFDRSATAVGRVRGANHSQRWSDRIPHRLMLRVWLSYR